MGSDPSGFVAQIKRSGFNPRSRMGSDDFLAGHLAIQAVFQSALPHGERPCGAMPGACVSQFQSALPHGERQAGRHGAADALPVSIRAPAWGATMRQWVMGRDGVFQSALPHGERRWAFNSDGNQAVFQSALPHGERPLCVGGPGRRCRFQSALPHGERPGLADGRVECLLCFNPRSRMGSDPP